MRYATSADLVEQLYRGLADNTVSRVIDGLLRVLVIDEVGFAPLDETGTQLLFRLVAAAYERRSLGIASHWPFEDWGMFLPIPSTAAALLDRLLSRIRDKRRYSEAPVIPRSLISREVRRNELVGIIVA